MAAISYPTPDLEGHLYALLNKGYHAHDRLAQALKREAAEIEAHPDRQPTLSAACKEHGIHLNNLATISPAVADKISRAAHKFETAIPVDSSFTIDMIKADLTQAHPFVFDEELSNLACAYAIRTKGALNEPGIEDAWKRGFQALLTAGGKFAPPAGQSLEDYCHSVAVTYDDAMKHAPAVFADYKATYAELRSAQLAVEKRLGYPNHKYWEAGEKAAMPSHYSGMLGELLEAAKPHGMDGHIRGILAKGGLYKAIEEIRNLDLPTQLHPLAGLCFAKIHQWEEIKNEIDGAWEQVERTLTSGMAHMEHFFPCAEHEGAMQPLSQCRWLINRAVNRDLSKIMEQASVPAASMAAEVGKAAVADEAPLAEGLHKAGAEAEKMAAATGGKMKWIIGSVAAVAVTIGAAAMVWQKKSHAAQVQQRRQEGNAAPAIG